MAKNKKNELDELLGAIKKSLNNKMTINNEDIATAMDVLKINQLKKEITETLEIMSNFKYTSKEKIKETLETFKNFLVEDFKILKETEDKEIAKVKKASKKKATVKKENEEVEVKENDNEVVEETEEDEEKTENLNEVQENNFN